MPAMTRITHVRAILYPITLEDRVMMWGVYPGGGREQAVAGRLLGAMNSVPQKTMDLVTVISACAQITKDVQVCSYRHGREGSVILGINLGPSEPPTLEVQ